MIRTDYGPSKSSDQNRLKVRIKVGSDNVLARNNAAIYSGLGLDISSPSSIEDSPDGCGSLSPEVNNVPHESPQTILQVNYSGTAQLHKVFILLFHCP